MKKLIVAAILALAACEHPKYPMCEYCAKPQPDARLYACRQCQGTHSSCRVEKPLHAMDLRKDKEGFATGFSIKVCPQGAAK